MTFAVPMTITWRGTLPAIVLSASLASLGSRMVMGNDRQTRTQLPGPLMRWPFSKSIVGTSDKHAIANLILGHLAEERGFDFLSEVKRGIGHWYAEHHASDRDYLGPDAAVEITITPR
jgi:hypothetical protein